MRHSKIVNLNLTKNESRFRKICVQESSDMLYPSRDPVFLRDVTHAVKSDMVFIIGESGSGKSLLARAIANKNNHTFIERGLSTTRDDFLESELRGVEKGQLDSQHQGLKSVFSCLNASTTLFFDEFGHLSKAGQRLFYPIIASRSIGRQLGSKELSFRQGQLIFALDYWHEKPDEQLINRILQRAVVVVMPTIYNTTFSDMDLVFEAVFRSCLSEKKYSSGVYDSRIIEELYTAKPDNGLRGIYQLLKQHDLTKPLTLAQWRQCNHEIQFKRHCLSALSKESLRQTCTQELGQELSEKLSKKLTKKGGVSCREHVLKEIERSFSFEGDEEVVKELGFLKECEVLEVSGQLIRPVKKKLILFLSVLDLCYMYPTLEEQSLHYYREVGSRNRPQNEVESFRKLKKRRTVPGFTLDQLSALKAERCFEHSERMLAAIKQHFQLFSSDDFLLKLICDEKSRLFLQR